ncbi:MAG: transcriptional regulator [Proteobacteria bacterium]|nr:transcriptional regulator [Pseudomonadota bacterium]
MQTVRQQIIASLEEKAMSGKEISQAVGVREKEVYEHLSHIARSVNHRKKKLVIMPSRCLACGFVFKDRRRFSPPGRCPQCKNEHIQNPTYRIT